MLKILTRALVAAGSWHLDNSYFGTLWRLIELNSELSLNCLMNTVTSTSNLLIIPRHTAHERTGDPRAILRLWHAQLQMNKQICNCSIGLA